jgi:hypothetical protein
MGEAWEGSSFCVMLGGGGEAWWLGGLSSREVYIHWCSG